jgi:hypothetical protein
MDCLYNFSYLNPSPLTFLPLKILLYSLPVPVICPSCLHSSSLLSLLCFTYLIISLLPFILFLYLFGIFTSLPPLVSIIFNFPSCRHSPLPFFLCFLYVETLQAKFAQRQTSICLNYKYKSLRVPTARNSFK